MSALMHLVNVSKNYVLDYGQLNHALQQLNLNIDAEHHLISLIGPDGSGKSTLIKVLASLLDCDAGSVTLNGISKNQIGYMSQTLGLYEDLSVIENLKLFAQLRDISYQGAALDDYLHHLLQEVGLFPFLHRAAGSLSGGMKQKLGLACAISAEPKLLLLDEPTVGVDPVSRLELWQIIDKYLKRTNSYCLFSSLYLEEAERSSYTIFIKNGRIIYEGDAQLLKDNVAERTFALIIEQGSYQQVARFLMCNLQHCPSIIDVCPRLGRIDLLSAPHVTDEQLYTQLRKLLSSPIAQHEGLHALPFSISKRASILEDAYISLTYEHSDLDISLDKSQHSLDEQVTSALHSDHVQPSAVVIDVNKIKKCFGDFTAVHDSSFKVYEGEIFGLLGPNGAGKTTTFRMICALLPPSAGHILINGLSLLEAKSSVRASIGYVAQKFCLYRKLTTLQNLEYFGQSYGLSTSKLQERLDFLIKTFSLKPYLDKKSNDLPFGVQRSLSMACALIHQPKILFLDEATSGADPTSRRAFWRLISNLARTGTTIIVTTHFMEEAEYCDRFLIQDQGKILVLGTPDDVCKQGLNKQTQKTENQMHGRISIEQAFIACVERNRQHVSC